MHKCQCGSNIDTYVGQQQNSTIATLESQFSKTQFGMLSNSSEFQNHTSQLTSSVNRRSKDDKFESCTRVAIAKIYLLIMSHSAGGREFYETS